jgi:integrase
MWYMPVKGEDHGMEYMRGASTKASKKAGMYQCERSTHSRRTTGFTRRRDSSWPTTCGALPPNPRKVRTVASIKKRPDGRWRARYRDPAGKEHARHFERKTDAEKWLTSVEHSKLIGGYVDPRAGRVTFGAWAVQWQASQVWRPNTALSARYALGHAVTRFGDRRLQTIRPSEVQAWVHDLNDRLLPSMVRLAYQYFRASMKAAVTDRLIASSPCEGVKLPAAERERVVPLTVEQVQAIAAAMPDRLRALVILGAGAGLRTSEALAVTVDRIDWMRRTLTVDRQLAGAKFAPPKSEGSRRTIPLPDLVLEALSQHLASYPSDGLIFTNTEGGPVRQNGFATRLRAAAKRAGLEGMTFRDLRHHYASLLIHGGESVKAVQSRLGHSSASITLDVYSHLWPDSEDRTRNAVDAAWRADFLRTETAEPD